MRTIPIKRHQDEFGFTPQIFNLAGEQADDGTRLRNQLEAKAQAEAETLAATPELDPGKFSIADCGCTKYKLCRVAVGLSKSVRQQMPGAASSYSDHRNLAMRQIERINQP